MLRISHINKLLITYFVKYLLKYDKLVVVMTIVKILSIIFRVYLLLIVMKLREKNSMKKSFNQKFHYFILIFENSSLDLYRVIINFRNCFFSNINYISFKIYYYFKKNNKVYINKKAFIFLFVIYLLLSNLIIPTAFASTENEIVYFYITSCSTCEKISPLLDNIEKQYNIKIIRKNIGIPDNHKEFYQYLEKCNVPNKVKGIVPTIFIGNKYYVGERDIREALRTLKKTSYYNLELNKNNSMNQFDGSLVNLKTITVFGAGVLDGINPCAISMLLFFLSFVLINERKNVLIVGGTFIIGTFMAYFFLGTVLYSLLGIIKVQKIRLVIKVLLLSFAILLLILNLKDYFIIKKGKHGNVILRLPLWLRRISHNLIRKIVKIRKNIYIMIITSFTLGVLISFTEFLCTGQIYLPTLVSIIQLKRSYIIDLNVIYLLIIYNFGFIIPLLVICFLVYYGKQIIDVSSAFSKNLHKIKIANAIFFLIIIIFTLIN